MPLSFVDSGESVKIIEVQGGHGIKKRLSEIGLVPGTKITVIQNGGGPFIIEVRGSRIVLGRGIAHRVMVTP